MRAAVVRSFGGPEVIETLKAAIPDIKSNQILVRTHYAGINPVDTYIRSGASFAKLPALPYTPGKDGAGIIEQIGDDVKGRRVGDRVWYSGANGASAQYTAVDYAYPLPDGVSFAEGASIGVPYLTAYRAMFLLAGAKDGDLIMVHGASGGVGSAIMQLAAWKKIRAVGTAGSDDGIEFVKGLKAEKVYNHTKDGYIEEMKKDYPNGFNYIFEMAAHINLNNDLGLLASNGKVAVIGSREATRIDARQLMGTEGSVFGVALGRSSRQEYDVMGEDIGRFLMDTEYRPIVGKEYGLEELGQAHKDIMENRGAKGNIVVKID